MEAFKVQVAVSNTEMEAFKVQAAVRDIELIEFKAKFAALDANDKARDVARLKMFLANLVVKLIDKVSAIQGRPLSEGSNDNAHSTNRYQAFATNMPDTKKSQRKWEQDTGLDHKYIKTVKNLAKYQKQRNKAAHETEYEFARLLLSDRYRDQHAHHHYGPVFKFVYNISVEDAAKVEREEDFEGKDEVNSDDEWWLKYDVNKTSLSVGG